MSRIHLPGSSRTVLTVGGLRLFFIIVGFAVSLFAAAGDGAWLAHVPEKDRIRPNPLASDPDSVPAGAKLFERHCAKCHGEDGYGRGKRPSLRSDRVKAAAPGELQWLLTNGSLKNGMPSWSGLPEPQRWQIISYLKTLQ